MSRCLQVIQANLESWESKFRSYQNIQGHQSQETRQVSFNSQDLPHLSKGRKSKELRAQQY